MPLTCGPDPDAFFLDHAFHFVLMGNFLVPAHRAPRIARPIADHTEKVAHLAFFVPFHVKSERFALNIGPPEIALVAVERDGACR